MSAESMDPREGDYFAIKESGPGPLPFNVIKVLNVDREGVHIRQCANYRRLAVTRIQSVGEGIRRSQVTKS